MSKYIINVTFLYDAGLSAETKLIKVEEEELLPGERLTQPYKFVTDIFFLTQQCLHIGFHVLLEDFYALNRQLHQLQEAYRDASAGGGATGNPLIARLHEEMEKGELPGFLWPRKVIKLCFHFPGLVNSWNYV